MSNSVSITTAFTLPQVEIDALMRGQTIVAVAKAFTTPGRAFALYPSDHSSSLSYEQFYRPALLLQASDEIRKSGQALVEAWARCEFCQILDEETSLDAISKLTIWTTEGLKLVLAQQHRIFLIYLRVYKLSRPVETSIKTRGQLVPLTNSLIGDVNLPVISEESFTYRRNQLVNLESPLHPELEALQVIITQTSENDYVARDLDKDLHTFLGWASPASSESIDPDLTWINRISEVGNSSDGNEFEKLVRRSLVKLGFSNSKPTPKASLDPDSTGGAGGIDVCCREPYPLVGECKASKNQSVPTDVCSQLTYLGQTHFSEKYDSSIKIIFAAGSLTTPANQVAIGNKMNVMRPETLQRLLDLKANHPGSIDLLKLKPCLSEAPFGEDADSKINQYINSAWHSLQLRSKLVKVVKQLTKPDKKQLEVSQISSVFNVTAFGLENQSAWLDDQTVYELLIELSSPLAGYLGRLQVGGLSSDRFYFLRDLPVDDITS